MHTSTPSSCTLAFIGGGNMASAIMGGLLKQGLPAGRIHVIEPWDEQRAKLSSQWGVHTYAEAGPGLAVAEVVVWAVKPQNFKQAAMQAGSHCPQALHLSVAAGVRSESIATWLANERIVRAMPNTPALIGQGIAGLFARSAVTQAERCQVEQIMQTTGQYLWLEQESLLDAVTALSGSGPAYVFYLMEAMVQAGTAMGLSSAQAQQLAVCTFIGAAQLAGSSSESPTVLRERVTSKGGTTDAALQVLEQAQVKACFIKALHAAEQRAQELGKTYV